MLFSILAFVFALSLLTFAVAVVFVLVSFVLPAIRRKIALWTMVGAAASGMLTLIGAGLTEPPTRTAAPQPVGRVGQSRVSSKQLSIRTAKPSATEASYFGDPPAKLAKQFQLRATDVRLLTEVQRFCAIAQRDDEETRHAKDSMGVAIALERVATEWELCDNAISHAIEQNAALRSRSDYDYVSLFGMIPSNALLQESGAYGSAGSEWDSFGQYARASEDYKHAVGVGRTMVSRGFIDEGKTVISDNQERAQ